ncbi:hypothetical protein, partial [Klebsiella pneumoniae]|uniref:hypothetical protein n=1 Tax=Klebsiella pneumoniae TaxID=573 RepID=UPI0035B58181
DERKIDFTLISSERAPRNVGKTAREKAKKSTSGKPGGRRRQVGDADQRDVLRRAAGHFLRRRIQLSGTIFWHDHRMHAGGV